MMRRWLLIFLLVLLPFQFSWGAAASYCQHETGRLASHFGHHEHQHELKQDLKQERVTLKSSSADQGHAINKLGALDDDCAMCHLGCVPPIAAAHGVNLVRHSQVHDRTAVTAFESHIPGVPQRPDGLLAV